MTYRVYQDSLSPKLGGGIHRHYWHGPGTVVWSADPDAAATFPTMQDARAAVVDQWARFPGYVEQLTKRIGYDFVPPVVEHLPLFPHPEETP